MEFVSDCPLPIKVHKEIQMGHGSGGEMTSQLLKSILSEFNFVQSHLDAAKFKNPGGNVFFTTDSYVVSPLFFPGGNIGSISVFGSINDLAMMGARAQALSLGLILEEGFEIDRLKSIMKTLNECSKQVGVPIVTGDTKVIERSRGDGVYINTSAVGFGRMDVGPHRINEGDSILLSGDVGRHGAVVMAQRMGLETTLKSDCEPLIDVVLELNEVGIDLHCMRDLTRGGLSSALVELCENTPFGMRIDEECVSVSSSVEEVCEVLGLDPFYCANEGRFVLFVDSKNEKKALNILKNYHESAQCIGRVCTEISEVSLKGRFGVSRILQKLSGDQLPRIC